MKTLEQYSHKNILKQISKQKNMMYFIIILILKLLIGYITSIVSTYIDPRSTENPIENYGLTFEIIVSLFLAPLIETLIFQLIIIELLVKMKINPSIIISISALLFGISHNYNTLYMVATTISGFIYAIYYYKLRNQGKLNSYLLVSGLHSLSNLPSLL